MIRYNSLGTLCARATLQQVERQQQQENGPGRDLDPPSVEEGEEDHTDDALPGQRRPRALRLGLGEGRPCGGARKNQALLLGKSRTHN